MNDDGTELSAKDLKAKIERVKEDITLLQSQADSTRRFEVLTEYLGYLQDELTIKQREENTQKNR